MTQMAEKKYILDKTTALKKLHRIALEVIEANVGATEIVLIGIKDNGLQIAKIVAAALAQNYKGKIKVVALEINKRKPAGISLSENIDFNNKHIVLIDDVANSGKTMLYALKPLLEFYPTKISTLALVERTHKAFPIAVDFVGLSLSSTLNEHIFVEVENGEVLGAYLQ